MNQALIVLAWFSGLAFSSYGLHCIFSERMKLEFKRYGLSHFRGLVGILEVLGGLGVILGVQWKPLMSISASGLTLLMVLGLIVRIRLKDRWIQMSPAAILLLVNAIIVFVANCP